MHEINIFFSPKQVESVSLSFEEHPTVLLMNKIKTAKEKKRNANSLAFRFPNLCSAQ